MKNWRKNRHLKSKCKRKRKTNTLNTIQARIYNHSNKTRPLLALSAKAKKFPEMEDLAESAMALVNLQLKSISTSKRSSRRRSMAMVRTTLKTCLKCTKWATSLSHKSNCPSIKASNVQNAAKVQFKVQDTDALNALLWTFAQSVKKAMSHIAWSMLWLKSPDQNWILLLWSNNKLTNRTTIQCLSPKLPKLK